MSKISKILNKPTFVKTNQNFAAPSKNQTALHPFLAAGDDHGVGKPQPIGVKPGKAESCVPRGAECLPLN